MILTPELLTSFLNLAVNLGVDAAIAIGKAVSKPGATLDDAIAALEAAKTKTSDDYLSEAKAAATPPASPS